VAEVWCWRAREAESCSEAATSSAACCADATSMTSSFSSLLMRAPSSVYAAPADASQSSDTLAAVHPSSVVCVKTLFECCKKIMCENINTFLCVNT
jgi:hypothetical protein